MRCVVHRQQCLQHIRPDYCKTVIFFLFLATQGLEYCEERYSQELGGSAFPLRAQATNTRLLSCQTVEKFRPHPDRDDSMNEGKPASPSTTWDRLRYARKQMSYYKDNKSS